MNVHFIPYRCTALLCASQGGHRDIVQLLLDAGADIEATLCGGATPLLLASQEGHLSTAQLLLKKGTTRKMMGMMKQLNN